MVLLRTCGKNAQSSVSDTLASWLARAIIRSSLVKGAS